MPFQNRVTPAGALIATKSRGTLMGNRGTLHNGQKEIVRTTDRKAWIYCELEFRERKQEVMAPGHYTQLFFLDEATALSAGHRPCARCKRQRYKEFISSLSLSYEVGSSESVDSHLSDSRLSKKPRARLSELPNGAFVQRLGGESLWIIWNQKIAEWTPSGYGKLTALDANEIGTVVTPPVVVQALRNGFIPAVHNSISSSEYDNEVLQHPNNLVPPDVDLSPLSANSIDASSKEDIPPSAESQTPFFKLDTTPRGKELYAYFGAILEETGMLEGHAYDLTKFMGNFSGHLTAQRILKTSDGRYLLSGEGLEYFQGRHQPGNKQFIDPYLFKEMKTRLREGGLGWRKIV